MLKPTRVKPVMRLHTYDRLLTLPANVRLGWKGTDVSNTLAYFDTATIMAVNSFTVQAHEPVL